MTRLLSRVRGPVLRLVCLVSVCLGLTAGPATAARVVVILSDDSAPYQEVYQVLRAHLDDSGHEVGLAYAEALATSTPPEPRLAVAVGVRAADSIAQLPLRVPALAVLVPRAWYLKNGRSRLHGDGRRVASAIYLDQPFERQSALLRLAFPAAKRVGVLLGIDQKALAGELDDALRTQGLALVHDTIRRDERPIPVLESILSDSDVLLAIPDPLVFNRNTAQSLFLTSYRYRVPVFGYSRSLTRAGALLSLHSSPAQIGRQTAEWLREMLDSSPVRVPPPAYPAYFSVSINDQVARSLGFALPPEAELERRMGGSR